MNIEIYLSMLGMKVEDRVTGIKGVATSLCFDLYGCIQICINPGLDKEGKQREQYWFDYQRLKINSKEPVMPQPNWCNIIQKGPAEKPTVNK